MAPSDAGSGTRGSHTAEERTASVEAVREALDDMRAGDTGTPAREFLADLRRKYHLPARRCHELDRILDKGGINPSGRAPQVAIAEPDRLHAKSIDACRRI